MDELRRKYYEKIHKEFEEDFKNHALKSVLTAHDAHLAVFDWRNKDECNVNAIRYIFSGNNLIVTGDIGNAIFNMSCDISLDNIRSRLFRRNHFEYLAEKLSVISGDKYIFEPEIAKNDITNYAEENDISEDRIQKYLQIAAETSSCYEWHDMFMENESAIEHIFGDYVYEWFMDCGRVLHPRFVGILTGLEMIHKAQDKTN